MASASVTLNPVTVNVSPSGQAMYPSSLKQFTATVGGTTNTSVSWAVLSGPGAINQYGVYTSPIYVASSQTVTVQAMSVADPSKVSTATVAVQPPLTTTYQYYLSDPMTSVNPNYWASNGASTATSGLTGGSVSSRLAVADGSSNYEVQATLHVPNANLSGAKFAVLARANDIASSGYSFAMSNVNWDGDGFCSATFSLTAMTAGGNMLLTQFPGGCHDGMKLRIITRGTSITLGIDTAWSMTLTDSSIPSGQGGATITPAAGATISNIQLGALDTTAPSAVTGTISSSASPNRVDLRWTAATDDTAGSGIAGYAISRAGISLGTSPTPTFSDETVSGTGASVSYSIVAFDWHGNSSAPTNAAVTVPNGPADPRRVGVRATGSYWGAAGEQIDLVSGNLNFALPIGSPKSRGGWSTTFMLSYNSQMWRQDAAGVWNQGKDVGFGFGWRLQAGSIYPVYFNTVLQYLIFSDATGAEYRLDDSGGSIFTSKEGLHLWMDWGARILHFPDGSSWTMGNVSGSLEPDAGTCYPTLITDTNGNFLS